MVRFRNASSFIPSARIKDVELLRLHGTMRVIRVDHDGGRLYLARSVHDWTIRLCQFH
jgi:hypothetical protein